MLLEIAERSSAGELDRLVQTYERVNPGKDKEELSHDRRALEWYYEDGMLIINASLPAEQGALVIKALEKVITCKKEEREKYWQILYEGGYGSLNNSLPGPASEEDKNRVIAEELEELEELEDLEELEERAEQGGQGKQEENAGTQLIIKRLCSTDENDSGDVSAELNGVDSDSVIDADDETTLGHVDETTPDHKPGNTNESVPENVSAELYSTEYSTECLTDSLLIEMSSREQKFADALVDIAEHYLTTGESGSRQRRSGNRYEVVLHIDRNQLAAAQKNRHKRNGGDYMDNFDSGDDTNDDIDHDNHMSPHKEHDPARYYVDPGWGIDEEAARQIACDADVTELIQDDRGDILNYERRSRIVPARLMRALMVRDRNCCRFPGCSHSKFLEAPGCVQIMSITGLMVVKPGWRIWPCYAAPTTDYFIIASFIWKSGTMKWFLSTSMASCWRKHCIHSFRMFPLKI